MAEAVLVVWRRGKWSLSGENREKVVCMYSDVRALILDCLRDFGWQGGLCCLLISRCIGAGCLEPSTCQTATTSQH